MPPLNDEAARPLPKPDPDRPTPCAQVTRQPYQCLPGFHSAEGSTEAIFAPDGRMTQIRVSSHESETPTDLQSAEAVVVDRVSPMSSKRTKTLSQGIEGPLALRKRS